MMKRYFVLAAMVCLTMGLNAQMYDDMPSSGFSSTSTLMGSGSSYASEPSMNANGMVEEPVAKPNRGRTAIPTPGDNDDDVVTPIGDVVLSLLLLAGVYGFYSYRRRKQA